MAAARITKEHEERKGEILDAAQALFSERGYDATSVAAIIDRIGISKGTFSHYFESKEELLDCLAARVTQQILERVGAETPEEGADCVTRLNTFFAVAGRWKAANLEVILMLLKALYREGNLPLRHRITQRMVDICVPVLAEAIEQGVAEGTFNVADPGDAAELIMQLAVAMRESTAGLLLALEERPELWPVVVRKIEGYQTGIGRVLGAPEGSIRLVAPGVMDVFRDQMVAGGAGRAKEKDARRH